MEPASKDGRLANLQSLKKSAGEYFIVSKTR